MRHEYEFRGRRYRTINGLFRAARKDNPAAHSFTFDTDGHFCAMSKGGDMLRYHTTRYPQQNITVIS